MCFITIELSFLNDMDGLEFLEEFDGRPPVSDQEFIHAYLSLTEVPEALAADPFDPRFDYLENNQALNSNTQSEEFDDTFVPLPSPLDALFPQDPEPQDSDPVNDQVAAGPVPAAAVHAAAVVIAPPAVPTKKACTECARRKMKCTPVEGSNPKTCQACHKRGPVCEYEAKKQ